jgi:hypothetical protein
MRLQQIVEKLHIKIVVLDDQHLFGALLAGTLITIHQFQSHFRLTPEVARSLDPGMTDPRPAPRSNRDCGGRDLKNGNDGVSNSMSGLEDRCRPVKREQMATARAAS